MLYVYWSTRPLLNLNCQRGAVLSKELVYTQGLIKGIYFYLVRKRQGEQRTQHRLQSYIHYSSLGYRQETTE